MQTRQREADRERKRQKWAVTRGAYRVANLREWLPGWVKQNVEGQAGS